MILGRALLAVVLAASSVMAHSNMILPIPRNDSSYAFPSRDSNSCETNSTNIPKANLNLKRGQTIPVMWWWNNHEGGFVKMAIIGGVAPVVGREGQDAFLARENIIQGQCYTRDCDRSSPDPGNANICKGHDLTFPNWLDDGVYTLQWSYFSGYNAQKVPTRSLPIYHTCANIRISGGVPLVPRPTNWVAPFFGGDQVKIKGEESGPDRCAFKQSAAEEHEPTAVDAKNDDAALVRFGIPKGWAVTGGTPNSGTDSLLLRRLGHIARNVKLHVIPNDE